MWEHSDALHSKAQTIMHTHCSVSHLEVGKKREGGSAAGNAVSVQWVLKKFLIFRFEKSNFFDNMTQNTHIYPHQVPASACSPQQPLPKNQQLEHARHTRIVTTTVTVASLRITSSFEPVLLVRRFLINIQGQQKRAILHASQLYSGISLTE